MRFIFPNKPVRVYNLEATAKMCGPDWIVQPKIDGHRAIVCVDGKGGVEVLSRHGNKLTLAKKWNWDWLNGLKLKAPFMLDGELTSTGGLFVWDFAYLGGEAWYGRPYRDRLTVLLDVPPLRDECQRLEARTVWTWPASKHDRLVCGLQEGVVFKDLSARDMWGVYSTVETPSQLKYKWR